MQCFVASSKVGGVHKELRGQCPEVIRKALFVALHLMLCELGQSGKKTRHKACSNCIRKVM